MIKTETKYTEKVFKDFATYNTSKASFTYVKICAIIIIVCAGFMLITESWVEGAIYAVIGVLFLFYAPLIKWLLFITNKKNINTKDIKEFSEKSFKVSSFDSKGNETASSTVQYSACFKTVKYMDYGYIYVNKVIAYIVNKSDFENVEDFEKILNWIQFEIDKAKEQDKKDNIKSLNKAEVEKQNVLQPTTQKTEEPTQKTADKIDEIIKNKNNNDKTKTDKTKKVVKKSTKKSSDLAKKEDKKQ